MTAVFTSKWQDIAIMCQLHILYSDTGCFTIKQEVLHMEQKLSLQAAARYISLELPKVWQYYEQQILSAYDPLWLDSMDLEKSLSYYCFDESYRMRVLHEAAQIRADELLNLACYAMYYSLFYSDNAMHQSIWGWSAPKGAFLEHGSYMTCVVAMLCGRHIHEANMKRRNFDEAQIDAHKKRIRQECINDRIQFGVDGIRPVIMMWCSIFMRGNILECGRLQYEVGTRNVTKLAPYVGESPIYVYIHIPGSGRLEEAAVEESLRRAAAEISRYFPEYRQNDLVYCTVTWLLSPELEKLLPKQSNIRKFQEKFYVPETVPGNAPFLNFLFKVGPETAYKDLPENTSLQRSIKTLLLQGQTLSIGVGLLKPEHKER